MEILMEQEKKRGKRNVDEASRLMAEKEIRRLPIQQNGILKGIVSAADLARALKKEMDNFFH